MHPTDSLAPADPITLLIDPAQCSFVPAITPPAGIKLIAGERRLGHGINNLLTAMFPYINDLELHGHDEHDRRRSVESLRDCANGMLRLVREAMESNKPSRMDLSRIAYDGQVMFGYLCRKRQINLECRVPEAVSIVAAPAAMLEIVTNLVANAMEACNKAGDTITVTTCQRGKEAILCVSDTGRGMNTELANRVFREDVTTRKDGHGIGLLTVLAHVADAHGKIRLTTRENGGTSFELLFPAAA